MSNPMNPIRSIEGTAGSGTGTTGVLFPLLPGEANALTNYIIVNRGSVELRMKKSALSTGPDASNNTDGSGVIIPAGQTHTYLRADAEIYFYLYAGSSCLYSIVVGSGE